MIKKLFTFNRKNSDLDLPKTIPIHLFSDFSHHNVPSYSRFYPSFSQMLTIQLTKQSFMKYLFQSQLQNVMFCYLDYIELIKSEIDRCNCQLVMCGKPAEINSVQALKNLKLKLLDSHFHNTTEGDISNVFQEFDEALMKFVKLNRIKCAYINLYLKYYATNTYASLRSNDDLEVILMIRDILDNVVNHRNSNNLLPSFNSSFIVLANDLEHKFYPSYLTSDSLRKYQLDLLTNNGLYGLKLADFIFYQEFLVHFIEYLERHSMDHYISFLLAVNSLSKSLSDPSIPELEKSDFLFESALQIYQQFLVADTPRFVHVPLHICNYIANKISSLSNHGESVKYSVFEIFSMAYKPIYYFLEEYWLPYFLMSENISKFIAIPRPVENSIDVNSGINDFKTKETVQQDDTLPNEEENISVEVEQIEDVDSLKQSQECWTVGTPSPTTMTLGHIDDMGEYRSCVNAGVSGLSTSSSAGSAGAGSTGFFGQKNNEVAPDELARQIIQEVTMMGYSSRNTPYNYNS